MIMGSEIHAVEWANKGLWLLDQTRLPHEEIYLNLRSWQEVRDAIYEMRVRGAPAIGVTAAYGVYLAAQQNLHLSQKSFYSSLVKAAAGLRSARPTAVNLSWALNRMLTRAKEIIDTNQDTSVLLKEAKQIQAEDQIANRNIGKYGVTLLPANAQVLTHCNTGALATTGYGTAFGVIRAGWEQGAVKLVYATEARPFMQGSRLTAWELQRSGISFRLLVDAAAGHVMATQRIDCVIVGADRIAANGDVANKVGTYTLAILAKEHNVPFYVAAPSSTIDLATKSGSLIPIENRPSDEVTQIGSHKISPDGTVALNPSFDITPARYISAIITERGIVTKPYRVGIKKLMLVLQ
jgi:methylthioribose-1-phosphate isomerase